MILDRCGPHGQNYFHVPNSLNYLSLNFFLFLDSSKQQEPRLEFSVTRNW